MADLLAERGMSIITTVPINRNMPPVPLLTEKGVPISLGCDSMFDSWGHLEMLIFLKE